MTSKQAFKWVEEQGVVLQSAQGSVPNFADWVVGERIRGSWWAHPRAHEVYGLAEAVCDSDEILVCKLIRGKVTYVHRRMWPALVRLAKHFSAEQLAEVESVHTSSGRHELKITSYPKWVPVDVKKAARVLTEKEAMHLIGEELFQKIRAKSKTQRR